MILAEYKIHNAEVLFREDATMDQEKISLPLLNTAMYYNAQKYL